MKSRSGVLLAALGASIVTALVVGGIGWAAIPDNNNVIHGCYANRDGALRVVDNPNSCNMAKEMPLPWSQTGPKGDTGDTGLRGPSGISHAYQATNTAGGTLTNALTETVHLDLPAGDYIAFARLPFATGTAATVNCVLGDGTSTIDGFLSNSA